MAKDIYHNQVKNALVKDGWHITHDPLFVQFGGVDVYVDLGAEKIIGAEKVPRTYPLFGCAGRYIQNLF